MSQPTNMHADAPTPALHSDSPGSRLRTLREARGLDLERIAAQLHLERRVVDAMEQDRYDSLPSPVFVAGYFRNYARLLGTDPDPIVASYRALVPAQESAFDTLANGIGQQASRGGNPWGWLIALALIAVVAVPASLWWQGRGGSESPTAATEGGTPGGDSQTGSTPQTAAAGGGDMAATQDGSPGESADTSEAAPVDSFGETVKVPSNAIPLRGAEPALSAAPPAEAAPNATQATVAATGAPSEPTPPAPPATREVVLEFTGTSWVDVRGADGAVVLNGEMRSGDRRALTGQPPYKLVIGNAAATRLTIGGEAFDLQERSQGNVARFALDPNAPQ